MPTWFVTSDRTAVDWDTDLVSRVAQVDLFHIQRPSDDSWELMFLFARAGQTVLEQKIAWAQSVESADPVPASLTPTTPSAGGGGSSGGADGAFKGAWSAGATYVAGDTVTHAGSTWGATTAPAVGAEPGVAGAWAELAASGAGGIPDGVLDGDTLVWGGSSALTVIPFTELGNNGLIAYARAQAIPMVASLKSQYQTFVAGNAIDGSNVTDAINNIDALGGWWQVRLTENLVVPTHFAIRSRSSGANLLANFTIQGSTDGVAWTDLSTVVATPQVAAGTWYSYVLDAPTTDTFSYFRIQNTGPDASGNHFLILSEFEVYGSLYASTAAGGWEVQRAASGGVSIPTFTATHAAGVGTLAWYNDSADSVTITGLRVTLSAAAVGAATVVDVNVDGTTALAAPVSVAVGQTTSGKTADEIVVPAGSALTVDVDSVGTPSVGETVLVQFYT